MGVESKREGFDAVYSEYRDLILKTACAYTHNQDDAEDIVQETFVRYFVHNSHSPVKNPRGWLMLVARNLALNIVKHGKYEKVLGEAENLELIMEREPDLEEKFFENMWRRELIGYTHQILGAVKEKNEGWYDALIYAFCMQMSRKEIADIMGITQDSLAGMLKRAKKWIKNHYEEEYNKIEKA